MVIGKGGANVDPLRANLNKLTGKQVHTSTSLRSTPPDWMLTLLVKVLVS